MRLGISGQSLGNRWAFLGERGGLTGEAGRAPSDDERGCGSQTAKVLVLSTPQHLKHLCGRW